MPGHPLPGRHPAGRASWSRPAESRTPGTDDRGWLALGAASMRQDPRVIAAYLVGDTTSGSGTDDAGTDDGGIMSDTLAE